MEIYDAVMKAADHIEKNPHLFAFDAFKIPDCGSPGCALGWIGHFAGFKGSFNVVADEMGVPALPRTSGLEWATVCPASTFYDRLRAFEPAWRHDAAACASALRAYAAKYLAPPKPLQAAPDWQAMAQRLAISPRISEAA